MKSLSLSQKRTIFLICMSVLTLLFFVISVFIGSSKMSIGDVLKTLFGGGSSTENIIIFNIRMPRVLAAIVVGAALSISGVIMQTMSNNVMASPSTLGVSNAAVLGANVAIIILGGGIIAHSGSKPLFDNPYVVSLFAFMFALGSMILVLTLARIKKFNNAITVLIGVTFGTFCTGLTTLVQYFADDQTLGTAIYWAFGDLGRANYTSVLIITVVLAISLIFFLLFSYKYNAILLGDATASTLGINLKWFRFISLLLASLLCAVSVSLFGIIGFIGLIIPQIVRRLIGNDHKFLIIGSALLGSVTLLFSDIISRILLSGWALPVGAVTSILGAPIFIVILLLSRRKK